MHFSTRALLLFLALCLFPLAAQAGKRVIYLGDSMSLGAFGTTLDKRLREAGLEVYTSVTGGATPETWLKEFESAEADIGHWNKTPTTDQRFKTLAAVPKLEDLMTQIHPDAVIVQTGVNLYSTLRSKRMSREEAVAKVESFILKMVHAVTSRGAKLYWITPPSSHPERYDFELQTLMLDVMQRGVGRSGRVFNSYAVTKFTDPYPETDGIHYGPTEAAAWGERVAADALPFLLKGKAAAPPPVLAEPAKAEVRRAKVVKEDPPAEEKPSAFTAEIKLLRKSEFTAAEITYNNGLAIYEWEILRIIKGNFSARKVLVAHAVVRNRRMTSECNLKLGRTYIVELVPLSTYPSIQRWDTVDKISDDNDFTRSIFIPKME